MAERAVAAPWIDTPQPSRWWIPAGALLYGVLVFGIGERNSLHPAVWFVLMVPVLALVGVWLGWGYGRLHAVPRLRSAPPEFVPAIRFYFIGYGLWLALVVTIFLTAGSRVAAVAAALGFYALLAIFTRWSNAAAAAVRKRLA